MAIVDLTRLKSQLAAAKVRETDIALFQVLNQLIDYIRQTNNTILSGTTGSGSGVTGLLTKTYITEIDETAVLVNSRALVGGTGITLDTSVAAQMIINSAAGADGIWIPLSDGDTIEPDLIFDSFGNCIVVFVPNP
jgi:hypothetical protein